MYLPLLLQVMAYLLTCLYIQARWNADDVLMELLATFSDPLNRLALLNKYVLSVNVCDWCWDLTTDVQYMEEVILVVPQKMCKLKTCFCPILKKHFINYHNVSYFKLTEYVYTHGNSIEHSFKSFSLKCYRLKKNESQMLFLTYSTCTYTSYFFNYNLYRTSL